MATRSAKKKAASQGEKGNGTSHAAKSAAEVLDTTNTPDSVLASVLAQENADGLVAKPTKGTRISKSEAPLTHDDLTRINTREGLVELLRTRKIRLDRVTEILQYEEELALLQIELVKLQRWVEKHKQRVAILFEGRDAAGKGGAIRRFTEHLNPRTMGVVALNKPSETEQGQWYFQRYTQKLPNPGELVFFDRSWYNRAVVEPVNGFCNKDQYERFMLQVPEFEHMLYEDGVVIIKFWFSISKKEQKKRFESRKKNPLKQWKLSPVDHKAQDLWDDYSKYKLEMFTRTHTSYAPWIIVQANTKRTARLESIRHVLSVLPYEGKDDASTRLAPDPNVVSRFHRKGRTID